MTTRSIFVAIALLLPPATAGAQPGADPFAPPPAIGDPPAAPADASDPGRDVANDPTSLSGRGGQAINARRTFQGAIGTSIYTPIGTSIGTQIGAPH